jgi:hypothetical protein
VNKKNAQAFFFERATKICGEAPISQK